MSTGKILSAVVLILSVCISNADSGAEAPQLIEKMRVIALKTDEVDLQELDISHLQPGDVETIVTDSGNRIDNLRTENDAEIYIDGKLLGTDGMHTNAPGARELRIGHENVEIICDSDTDCDEAACAGSPEVAADDAKAVREIKKVYIIHREGETR